MACLCADGNHPVASETLVMQGRTERGQWHGNHQRNCSSSSGFLLLAFLTPVGIFITWLWPSPVKWLHQVRLVVSVPSLASAFPLLLSVILPLKAQKHQGIYFLNTEPWTISCLPFVAQRGPGESRIGLRGLSPWSGTDRLYFKTPRSCWDKLGLTMKERDRWDWRLWRF